MASVTTDVRISGLRDLRHGFASLMLTDGVSLTEVLGLLGHSSERPSLASAGRCSSEGGRATVGKS